jgi:hypothetical protein
MSSWPCESRLGLRVGLLFFLCALTVLTSTNMAEDLVFEVSDKREGRDAGDVRLTWTN